MKKVLAAGATGYLGQYILRELKKQNYWVRALTRNSSRLNGSHDLIDEEFIAEVTDPNSLIGICKDMDVVISSIGITKQKDGLTFMDVDYQGNMNLLYEARRAGVSKFIFVSVFNAEKMKDLKVIQAKLKFEEALKASGLDYAVIYPNGFFSDMLEYLKMAKKGKGYVFGSGDYQINPIHGEDLARICVNAIGTDEKAIDAGGPDILSHNEILKLAFKVVNKKPKIFRVPVKLVNSLISILKIFAPEKKYGPVEFFTKVLASDLVAPSYGVHHLKDFFRENKINV